MRNIKAWMQAGGVIVLAVWAALTDTASTDVITSAEWVLIASTAAGSVGVHVVPNFEAGIGRYAKGVVSFLTAALPAVSLSLAGGLTNVEMVEALVVGLAAVGLVAGVPERGYVFATKRLINATGNPGVDTSR